MQAFNLFSAPVITINSLIIIMVHSQLLVPS